jgi:hypothetical protein
MSRAANAQIECLKRLDELTASYDAMIEFLQSEDLLTREEGKAIRSSSEIPKMLHSKLATLSKTNKLQLLEYEWIMLPAESIRITVVTDRASREFTWSS